MFNGRTSNLRRSPIKRKARKPKPGDDPKYREFIRSLPCLICHKPVYQYGILLEWFDVGMTVASIGPQVAPTEFAHLGERGLGQKCPDSEGAPLCAVDHRTGPFAHHVLGKKWASHHGIDKQEIFAMLQEMYRRSL